MNMSWKYHALGPEKKHHHHFSKYILLTMMLQRIAKPNDQGWKPETLTNCPSGILLRCCLDLRDKLWCENIPDTLPLPALSVFLLGEYWELVKPGRVWLIWQKAFVFLNNINYVPGGTLKWGFSY